MINGFLFNLKVNRMKKSILLGLTFVAQFGLANADVMKDAYRDYDEAKRCYIGINKSDNGINKFCMMLYAKETVENEGIQGDYKTYYLAIGNNFNSSHVSEGNVGLIIEENSDGQSDNIIAVEKYIGVGSSGEVPSAYQFKKIGFNSYGFFAETGYIGQGISQGGIFIVGDNAGQIFSAYIPTFFDNGGFYVDDEDNLESIEGEYKILTNSEGGLYPIEVTLTGNYGGKDYQNQSYIFNYDYDNQEYTIPADYPFQKLD